MYGYIYITKNLINNHCYIGQKKSCTYIKSYYGSGKNIRKAIKQFGKKNFTNEILVWCETKEELNFMEKHYINIYSQQYPCYNIAQGGIGGDVWRYCDEHNKNVFVEKMTKINQQRCSTEQFKQNQRKNMINRYSDESERIRHSKIVKQTWSNEKLRKEQSDRLKQYNEQLKKQGIKKPAKTTQCAIIHNNELYKFNSINELKEYIVTKYGFCPSRRKFQQLLNTQKPYMSFHKKFEKLNGAVIYRLDEGVETKGDECNPVEVEIDTTSKCEAM